MPFIHCSGDSFSAAAIMPPAAAAASPPPPAVTLLALLALLALLSAAFRLPVFAARAAAAAACAAATVSLPRCTASFAVSEEACACMLAPADAREALIWLSSMPPVLQM